jgi:hypothetical protein
MLDGGGEEAGVDFCGEVVALTIDEEVMSRVKTSLRSNVKIW